MSNEEYINFLKTVDKLPREYYSIIREGILQINDDKKELFGVIDELKNRIDKAIKYINNNKLYNYDYDEEEMFEIVSDTVAKDYLLNILKGRDKE